MMATEKNIGLSKPSSDSSLYRKVGERRDILSSIQMSEMRSRLCNFTYSIMKQSENNINKILRVRNSPIEF